jgi:hypothetical protein
MPASMNQRYIGMGGQCAGPFSGAKVYQQQRTRLFTNIEPIIHIASGRPFFAAIEYPLFFDGV